MDQLIRESLLFSDSVNMFTLWDVLLALGLSFFLNLGIGYIYRVTHRGLSYSQSYVHTLIMMGVIVALIMLVIGSNIARAFSLVGALSIIRFRNAVKETRDVGFLFMAMAIGMCCGTRFYLLAVIATALIITMVYSLNRFDVGSNRTTENVLRVHLSPEEDPSTFLNDVFVKYLESFALISQETVRHGALVEATYHVKPKPKVKANEFLTDIRALTGNGKVALIAGLANTEI